MLPLHLQAVKEHAHDIKLDEKNKCKSRQKNKFQKLLAEQTGTGYQRKWAINLSSKIITDQQKSVLSKGLNFAPTPCQIPTPRIVANIETALKSCKADLQTTSQGRSRIVGILSKSPKLTPNLSCAESQALKELKKIEGIVFLPADKGRATVIMDRDKHNEKILAMLSDEDVYRQLKGDPTASLERKINSTLLNLNKYSHLRSSGGLTPRIYVLPKILKQNVPLRPIVSFYTSLTY